jgi:nifR3 family TIM-barrel protein
MNKNNFWQKLKRPFFCLAPMADVTDIAFRTMFVKYGRPASLTHQGGPEVLWTEFVSADGLAHPVGRKKLLPILKFNKKEQPIMAQIFGSQPENIKKASALIARLGFAGVDINMGCPDKSVLKQGAGAALIKNPARAREVIRAARTGAPKLPISVKTRLGFNTMEYRTWLPELLQEDISALTIHLRTKKEMSRVPAHYELAREVVGIVRAIRPDITLIVNGDIFSKADGVVKAQDFGFDGVMVGRGAFGNPWFFTETTTPTESEKIKALVEHIKLFSKYLSKQKSYAVMKKHFKAYINGWDGAKELRNKMMATNTPAESLLILTAFQKILK